MCGLACEDHARLFRLDSAFLNGDLDTIRAELGAVEGFPNVVAHPAIGGCLTHAIFHSPLTLIAAPLEAGADPSWPADDGFPPLIAAMSVAQVAPGAMARTDSVEIVGAAARPRRVRRLAGGKPE